MKKVRSTFFTGLVLFLPVALAVFCVIWSFTLLDSILEPLYTNIFGAYWSGLGFLTLIIIIFIIFNGCELNEFNHLL